MPSSQRRKAALAGAAFRYSVLDAEPNADILKRTAANGNAVRPAMTDPSRESEKQKAVTTNHGFPWTTQCTFTIEKYSDPVRNEQVKQGLESSVSVAGELSSIKSLRNNHAI